MTPISLISLLTASTLIIAAVTASAQAVGKGLSVTKWETTYNVEELSEGKWRSTTDDPFLVSAPLGDAPTEGMQFEVRMKVTGPPGYGEIRWWGKGEGPHPDRTLGFSPICDGQWHTYTISPFLQLRDWGRAIEIIRIDPTNKQGSEIEIESVTLVPVDLSNIDYNCTVQLSKKLPYADEPMQFLVYYPRPWTGDLQRPMFSYKVTDLDGAVARQGAMIGAPAYNKHYSIVHGLESIDGLPNGHYLLDVELRNDKDPDKPVTGSISFEVIDPAQRRILSLPWQYVKDYTVIYAEGKFHAFGIIGRADQNQDWGEEVLQNEKQLFHATSVDLAYWTQHADVLYCLKSGYDERGVWAPHLIKADDTYWMFYTGVQNGVTQRMCAATSPDLQEWTRLPENPLMSARETDWTVNNEGGWTDYRDPMIFRDEANNRWIAYNVASQKAATPTGAVAAAISDDLINWKDAGAVFTGPYIPESPFVWKTGDKYYMSINAGGRGIYVSDSPLGPFTTRVEPDPMPQHIMAYELLQIKPDLLLLSGFAWQVNGNYIEFFEMRMEDGKPVVSRDLSRILEAVKGKQGKD